jgi:hypothetical protein
LEVTLYQFELLGQTPVWEIQLHCYQVGAR